MTDAAPESEKATLHFPGGSAEFPVIRGTDGHDSIDISTFTKQTGFTTLDQGFVNTASTRSAITYIDGDKGILRYRGYAIEDVAKNSTYLEVAWLLIYGELPSESELAEFDEIVDVQNLRIACRVNGEYLQDSTTSQMIFGVDEIISYLSRFITLLPGDVITTGTPVGVGFARTPPIYLSHGDTVEIDIEGIGVLRNTCGPVTSSAGDHAAAQSESD